MAELSEVHGRAWDDVDVSNNLQYTRNPDYLTLRGLSSIDLVARGYCTSFYIICSMLGGTHIVWTNRNDSQPHSSCRTDFNTWIVSERSMHAILFPSYVPSWIWFMRVTVSQV